MTNVHVIRLRRASDGELVEAQLIDGVTLGEIRTAQADWRDFLMTAPASAAIKEHSHWNWVSKARFALAHRDYRLIGVACAGQMQGLMLIAFHHKSRLESQADPVIYIDYLSTAPWNLRGIASPTKYGGVGRVLLAAAIAESRRRGWAGRIALHSLPQAEDFYTRICGMNDMGIDFHYESLRYFEMTPEQAEAFEGRV